MTQAELETVKGMLHKIEQLTDALENLIANVEPRIVGIDPAAAQKAAESLLDHPVKP